MQRWAGPGVVVSSWPLWCSWQRVRFARPRCNPGHHLTRPGSAGWKPGRRGDSDHFFACESRCCSPCFWRVRNSGGGRFSRRRAPGLANTYEPIMCDLLTAACNSQPPPHSRESCRRSSCRTCQTHLDPSLNLKLKYTLMIASFATICYQEASQVQVPGIPLLRRMRGIPPSLPPVFGMISLPHPLALQGEVHRNWQVALAI